MEGVSFVVVDATGSRVPPPLYSHVGFSHGVHHVISGKERGRGTRPLLSFYPSETVKAKSSADLITNQNRGKRGPKRRRATQGSPAGARVSSLLNEGRTEPRNDDRASARATHVAPRTWPLCREGHFPLAHTRQRGRWRRDGVQARQRGRSPKPRRRWPCPAPRPLRAACPFSTPLSSLISYLNPPPPPLSGPAGDPASPRAQPHP